MSNDEPDFLREDTYVEELELDIIEEQLKGPRDPAAPLELDQ
jgi:hypothetical protein